MMTPWHDWSFTENARHTIWNMDEYRKRTAVSNMPFSPTRMPAKADSRADRCPALSASAQTPVIAETLRFTHDTATAQQHGADVGGLVEENAALKADRGAAVTNWRGLLIKVGAATTQQLMDKWDTAWGRINEQAAQIADLEGSVEVEQRNADTWKAVAEAAAEERDANIQTIHAQAAEIAALRYQRRRALLRGRARGHNRVDHFDRTIYNNVTKARQLITKAGLALQVRDLCAAGPIQDQVAMVCDLLVERSQTIRTLKAERDELKTQLAQATATAQSLSAAVHTVE